MRLLLALALLLASAASARAQGWIIPDACPPTEPECSPPDRCPPEPPSVCPSTVFRTSSDVQVELAEGVLQYEVEETFVNRGGLVGEADYLFPLPRGAAFQDLKLSINGELVAGETMDAEEARRIYEEIVRRKRDPALVEWMGRGLLRTRIFPIAPGEEKKVVVRFQMVAEREGDAIRVDYFRGGPPETGEQRAEPSGRLSFVLSYPADEKWGTPYSPTHSLRTTESGGRRRVEVEDNARELTLLLPVRRSSEPAISVLAHTDAEGEGFALLTLTPPAVDSRRTPRDLTFVLDVSGSMSARKLEQARAAGAALLATLGPEDRFRLIDFSTDVRTFRDGFVAASADNIGEAERYLEDLEAGGSTNIGAALEQALAAESEAGRLAVVLFVTDGEPTVGEREPEAIGEMVARHRKGRRIFTFGLGADVNVPLLEQLALEGGGTAQFVRPDESVERAVSVVASRLVDPLVTDLRVEVDGVRLSKLHPSDPVDLFAGQDLVLLGRYEGSGRARVRFTGQTSNGSVDWTDEVEFPERERDNAFVPRLWATQRVGYLSAEKRRLGSSGRAELDAEIRELGERYGIPTEFTSYFVREPDAELAQTGATVRSQEGSRSAASPSSAPMRGRNEAGRRAAEQEFNAAKTAGELRAARTLADADRASQISDASPSSDGQRSAARADLGALRRAGERIFVLRDGVWVDRQYREGMETIRVRAFSRAYFELLASFPELRPALALGDRVIVAGEAVAIEVGLSGVGTLEGAELRRIRAAW